MYQRDYVQTRFPVTFRPMTEYDVAQVLLGAYGRDEEIIWLQQHTHIELLIVVISSSCFPAIEKKGTHHNVNIYIHDGLLMGHILKEITPPNISSDEQRETKQLAVQGLGRFF